MQQDQIDHFIAQWRVQRPDLDPAPLAIVSRILMLFKYLEASADRALAGFDLPLWQFDVLAALRRSGPPFTLAAGELLESLTLTSGAVTHRIDRLEAKGLVERGPDPADRRGVLIRLTARGRRIVDTAIRVRLDNAAADLAVFSESDRRTLAALLRTMLVGLAGAAARSRPRRRDPRRNGEAARGPNANLRVRPGKARRRRAGT